MDEEIRLQVTVATTPQEVWTLWTTEEGICSFFAPACKVDLRPGGAYEIYFDLEQPPGLRGGEEMVFLALEQPSMLSFTWNAPPALAEVRNQRTQVVIRIDAVDAGHTRVRLVDHGFGTGGQWPERVAYFRRAWGQIVLPLLAYRVENGPIDWDNYPDFSNYVERVSSY
ncbi:MAG: SRPBCC domain-containing protein [Anaerolineales bacterium]|nr:SRPBCC domain-containing protein [Anaerolineales bacterium]MBX3005272.1 SRPBCC domain-containing protein [Anaerolineales bacterium]MCW5886943.1 SRPBCC domain-containing protein [Anaerolineales bacterium]